MAVMLKCKMCGGDLLVTEGSTLATCEYCGSQQTIPSLDNEKKLSLFARANKLRAGCDFDKAAGVYESIVTDFPEEAEAYWGLVLCKYGIDYVDDPATGKKIPTCHRSSFDSVMEDGNFELTMENADAAALQVYRKEAKAIEQIRKGIIEVSSKEDPYDIFICYKETDAKGDRTVDSLIAQDVYDALTEKGYRVFFSRITLEDKLGTAYEPHIFAALNSAKIMLAVGTAYEHYNAVWVKNEWSRYLKLMETDKSKHLIPCFKDIDAYDIPKEFKHLQAQDMGKVGAIQDLLRGVEKLLSTKEKKQNVVVAEGMTKAEKNMVEQMRKNQKRILASVLCVILGAIFAFLSFMLFELGADGFFDIIAYDQGRAITWTGDPRVMSMMFQMGLFGVGLGLIITYGFRDRVAHWLYMVVSIWSVVRILLVVNAGYTPNGALGILFAAFALFALITTLVGYRHKKAALVIHILILAVLTVVAVASGGFAIM